MKTPEQVREAKTRMINQGKMIAELTDNKAFKFILNRMKELVEEGKESALNSESFEELRYRRGYLDGLNALETEVTTIISRGKSQERTFKK